MRKRGLVFWLLVAVSFAGLAASGRILMKRAEYEKANRTVQVVLDYPSLLAQLPPTEKAEPAIDRIKRLGVEDFGVYEFKADELIEKGELSVGRGGPASDNADVNVYGGTGLEISEPSRVGRVAEYLNAYFGEGACRRGADKCYIPDIGMKIEDLTFGLYVPRFDVDVVPRFFNTPFENRNSIRLKTSVMDEVRRPSVVVFDGESVLGYPGLLDVTAGEIIGKKRRKGWNYGMVEMVAQDGAAALAKKLPGRVLIVHSITEEEMAKTSPGEAVARYRRAVRERGVRILYVRLYTDLYGMTPRESLDRNIKFLGDIIGGVKADGFRVGKAEPLKPFIVSRRMRALCVAGAIAFTGLLCWAGFGLPGWLSLLGAAAGFAMALVLPETGAAGGYLIKLTALGAASFVPAMSVAVLFLVNTRRDDSGLIRPGAGGAVARWAAACALALAAGAMVAALLSQREYFLRLDVFSGVKVAFLMPLLLVVLLYIYHTGEKLGDFFNSPVRYGEAAAALFVLAALAVYLLRSGNESAGAVTPAESALRMYLESLLAVRPRFKEFAIGHPALLLVGFVPLGKKRYLGLLLLLFGVIGQISILNTYCHLHTPILISYFRTVLGMAIGLAAGLVLRASLKSLSWAWTAVQKGKKE